MKLVMVRTNRLKFKNNLRDGTERRSYGELRESVRNNGILTPLEGIELPDGNVEVTDGAGRGQIAIELGIAEVPVYVAIDSQSREHSLKRQLVTNTVRENLNAVDFSRGFTQLMEETGQSSTKLAEELGLRSTVSKKLALNKLPEAIRLKVEQGKIPASTAYELTHIKDPAMQAELAAQVEAGDLTREALIQIVRSLKQPVKKPGKTLQRANLPVDAATMVSVSGSDLTLSTLVNYLESLLKLARRELRRGMALDTFVRLVHDKAKA